MSQTVLLSATDLDIRIGELRILLPRIWSRESSGFPFEWSPKNPSCGQCYPTARLVQTLFGGEIIYQRLRFDDGEYIHFVNDIEGVRYDLSSEQMVGESFVVVSEEVRTADNHRMFELLPHIRRMVDKLFLDYSEHTGKNVAPR